MPVTFRRTLTVLTVALSFLLVAGPADAGTRTFTDPADAPATQDIRKVKVTVKKKYVRVVVRVKNPTINYGRTMMAFYLDTLAKRRGPEYAMWLYPDSEGHLTRTTKSWKAKGRDIRCAVRGTYSVVTPKRVTLRIPTKCLGNPKRVRVAVQAVEARAGKKNAVDWAPKRKGFYPWVRR